MLELKMYDAFPDAGNYHYLVMNDYISSLAFSSNIFESLLANSMFMDLPNLPIMRPSSLQLPLANG